MNKVILIIVFFFFTHSAFVFGGEVSDPDIFELKKAEQGELVVRTKKIPGAPWPEVTVYSVIEAKPEECMGVFYAYHEHKEFIPDLLISRPSKYISPSDLHIYFEMNIPWPMRNSRYTTGNRLSRTGDGGFRIRWYHVGSNSSRNTWGSVNFRPRGEKTLFIYKSFVHPKSGLAGMFKKRMIREVRHSVRAVIGRIERIKRERIEKLPGYISALYRSLKGEYIYKNIPRPRAVVETSSH